jgi:hypothetical protein
MKSRCRRGVLLMLAALGGVNCGSATCSPASIADFLSNAPGTLRCVNAFTSSAAPLEAVLQCCSRARNLTAAACLCDPSVSRLLTQYGAQLDALQYAVPLFCGTENGPFLTSCPPRAPTAEICSVANVQSLLHLCTPRNASASADPACCTRIRELDAERCFCRSDITLDDEDQAAALLLTLSRTAPMCHVTAHVGDPCVELPPVGAMRPAPPQVTPSACAPQTLVSLVAHDGGLACDSVLTNASLAPTATGSLASLLVDVCCSQVQTLDSNRCFCQPALQPVVAQLMQPFTAVFAATPPVCGFPPHVGGACTAVEAPQPARVPAQQPAAPTAPVKCPPARIADLVTTFRCDVALPAFRNATVQEQSLAQLLPTICCSELLTLSDRGCFCASPEQRLLRQFTQNFEALFAAAPDACGFAVRVKDTPSCALRAVVASTLAPAPGPGMLALAPAPGAPVGEALPEELPGRMATPPLVVVELQPPLPPLSPPPPLLSLSPRMETAPTGGPLISNPTPAAAVQQAPMASAMPPARQPPPPQLPPPVAQSPPPQVQLPFLLPNRAGGGPKVSPVIPAPPPPATVLSMSPSPPPQELAMITNQQPPPVGGVPPTATLPPPSISPELTLRPLPTRPLGTRPMVVAAPGAAVSGRQPAIVSVPAGVRAAVIETVSTPPPPLIEQRRLSPTEVQRAFNAMVSAPPAMPPRVSLAAASHTALVSTCSASAIVAPFATDMACTSIGTLQSNATIMATCCSSLRLLQTSGCLCTGGSTVVDAALQVLGGSDEMLSNVGIIVATCPVVCGFTLSVFSTCSGSTVVGNVAPAIPTARLLPPPALPPRAQRSPPFPSPPPPQPSLVPTFVAHPPASPPVAAPLPSPAMLPPPATAPLVAHPPVALLPPAVSVQPTSVPAPHRQRPQLEFPPAPPVPSAPGTLPSAPVRGSGFSTVKRGSQAKMLMEPVQSPPMQHGGGTPRTERGKHGGGLVVRAPVVSTTRGGHAEKITVAAHISVSATVQHGQGSSDSSSSSGGD